MRNLFIYLSLLLVTISCTDRKTVSNKANENQLVDFSNANIISSIKFGDEKFFDQCSIVKLELTDNSIIGDITQMEILNDTIYILDKKGESLLIFDS